jgi:hypothetical protein
VDNPSGHSCYTAQGVTGACNDKIEGVQYNVQGHAAFFCEKHALLQNDWDKIHYRSKAKEQPELTAEQLKTIAKLLEPKKKKKEQKQEELEDRDLMA